MISKALPTGALTDLLHVYMKEVHPLAVLSLQYEYRLSDPESKLPIADIPGTRWPEGEFDTLGKLGSAHRAQRKPSL